MVPRDTANAFDALPKSGAVQASQLTRYSLEAAFGPAGGKARWLAVLDAVFLR